MGHELLMVLGAVRSRCVQEVKKVVTGRLP